MKIVVLAGGLSPERNVSLSSGTKVSQALRDLGHDVALVDLYFGLEDYPGLEPEGLYSAPPGSVTGQEACWPGIVVPEPTTSPLAVIS